MGLPVSLILIAVGAILAFAVNQSDPNPPVEPGYAPRRRTVVEEEEAPPPPGPPPAGPPPP